MDSLVALCEKNEEQLGFPLKNDGDSCIGIYRLSQIVA